MKMQRLTIRIGVFMLSALTVLAFASIVGPREASGANISGAIFTTTAGGVTVNGNVYDNKADVYLNGGPNAGPHVVGSSQCTSAGLDDDDYYFQVTTPNGDILLSTDLITSRQFHVAGGIWSYTGTHATTPSNCGVAIQLIPYSDSNQTGEYKVWVTRVGDYSPSTKCQPTSNDANCSFGFLPSSTKTDNFRIRQCTSDCTPPPVTELRGLKFYDANPNAIQETGENGLSLWPIQICNVGSGDGMLPAGKCQTLFTNTDGSWLLQGLDPSTYTVREGIVGGWYETCPNTIDQPSTNFDFFCSVGTLGTGFPTASSGSGVNLYTFGDGTSGFQVTLGLGGQVGNLDFGNVCTGSGNGVTLGYWSNKNGQAKIGNDDLYFLRGLYLKDGFGCNFEPTTYAQLRTWLLNGTAVNMAYMLSVQLATMELAVFNHTSGFGVDGNSLIYAPGTMSANFLGFATVNAVMNEANSALGSCGTQTGCGTPCDATTLNQTTIQRRAYFEILKNALDKANNNLTFVQTDPSTCPAEPTAVAE
jgi:hypothetical protein